MLDREKLIAEFRAYLNESKEDNIKKIISKIQSESVKTFADVFADISRFSGLVPIFRNGEINITTKINDFNKVIQFNKFDVDSIEWWSNTPDNMYGQKMTAEDLFLNIKHIKKIYDIVGLSEYPESKIFFKQIQDFGKKKKLTTKKDDNSITKESVITQLNDIFKKINGKKTSKTLYWSTESRDTARDAYKIANKKVPTQIFDFFEKKPYESEDGTHDYNNDDRYFRTEKYKPKKEYEDIITSLTIGGYDTGDYSGDWAKAYIEIIFK